MSNLSSELLKMRGKLRKEHEAILHELQHETIEKVEKELQESLKKLEEDIENEKEHVVLGVLKIFVYHLDGSKSLFHDKGDATVSHDVSFYTSPDSEVNDLTSNVMLDAANEVMSMSNQFVLERQGDLLEDMESVLETQLHHTDFVGQQNWQNSVSRLSQEWDELSCHPVMINDTFHHEVPATSDESTIRTYMHDQATIADSIMAQELSFELFSLYKRLLFEFSLIQKRITARATEHKQSTEVLVTMIANLSGTPNDVKLESVLMSQMKQHFDHLRKAIEEAKVLYIENITDSMKLCILQQLQDTKISQVKLRASLLELIDDISDRFVRYSAMQHLDTPLSKTNTGTN